MIQEMKFTFFFTIVLTVSLFIPPVTSYLDYASPAPSPEPPVTSYLDYPSLSPSPEPPVTSYLPYPSPSPSTEPPVTSYLDYPSPSPSPEPPEVAPTLESWIATNLGQGNNPNAASLDHLLVQAEENGFILITVGKNGTGDFDTVTAALDSVPLRNKQRVVIWIGGGCYFEKIQINRTKDFVTLFGDPLDMPTIVFNGTAAVYGTLKSATVGVDSDYFVAVNIIFMNSAPMPDGRRLLAQAVAMRISGDKAAFHNCKFIGFQDTLCDDRGMHFFKDCYIEGTVDFIFGNGKSIYLNTTINSVAQHLGVITAQGREKMEDNSGFAFLYCTITGTGNHTTYLGRAWRQSARVIFAYTYMDTVVYFKGWSTNRHPEWKKTVYYGEYMCKGPGASPIGRVTYTKMLSDIEAKPFVSISYINGSNWLLPPPS